MKEDNRPTEPFDPSVDVINRLERVIDHQVGHLESIDVKAGRIMRIIALLIGLLLTGISIAIRTSGPLPTAALPVQIAFGVGVLGLAMTVIAAVITYVSSKLRFGLHPSVADTFEKRPLNKDQYTRFILNAYSSALEDNKKITDTNDTRFRVTLGCFMTGINFTGLSVVLYLSVNAPKTQWALLVVFGMAIAIVAVLIVTRKLIPPTDES